VSEFVSALAWHAKDRRILPLALVRLPLCNVIALAPLVVGLPTHYGLVSIAFLLPTVFGVLGAMTLRENIGWLRPRNPRLWACRLVTTASLDLVCLLGLLFTLSSRAEREGNLAGALLAAAASMAVACFAEEFAWLAAAGVGVVCMIALERPLVSYLSVSASLIAYTSALIVLSITGPASRDGES
jgi:hypothetical protein